MSRANRALVATLLTSLLLLILAVPGPLRATVGEQLLEDLSGEPLPADAFADGATLLVVWAPWSPRCRDIVAHINLLAEAWSAEARIASVVFQATPELIRELLASEPLRAPVYFDRSGDFSQQNEVTTLPMLLIFRNGELVFRGRLSANSGPVIERALG